MVKNKQPLSLNLGCGFDHRPGFTNVDIDPATKPDLIHDLAKPLPFPNQSAKEIILQDVLEHFTWETGLVLLRECRRVLQPEGQLQLRVPNVIAIVRKFWMQPDLMMHFLYGNTSQNGVWGAHKVGYSPRLLRLRGWEVGLELITAKTVDTNWEVSFVATTKPLQVVGPIEIVKKIRPHLSWQTGNVKVITSWLSAVRTRVTSPSSAVVWYQTKPLPSWILKTGGRVAGWAADAIFVSDVTNASQLSEQGKVSHLKVRVVK